MAKLTALPEEAIIAGFRGVLDFYLWKGVPCVRSWPRKPKLPRSPAVQAASQTFGYLSTAFSSTPPVIKAQAEALAVGTAWTWRDVRYRAAYGNLIAED